MKFDHAILIHGYSLLTSKGKGGENELKNRSWEHVVWGDVDRQILGRIPYGILKTLVLKPNILILGSGATCIQKDKVMSRLEWRNKGCSSPVKWESEITFEAIQNRFEKLLEFKVLEKVINDFGGLKKAIDFIASITVQE